MKQSEPPKWVLNTLRFICHPDFLEELEGDFLEKYHADLQRYGLKVARRKCHRQLLSMITPKLIFNLNQRKMKSVLNIKENPARLLLFAAPVIMLALLLYPDAGFQDITLFSVPLLTMVWVIPLLLASLWLLYILTRKFLYSSAFTWMHVLTTVVATLLITGVLFLGINPSPSVSEHHELVGNAMQLLSVVFVLGQLIYLANFVLGLLGRGKAE